MADPSPLSLTTQQQATLNNLRAIVRRQMHPTSPIDAEQLAALVLQHAELMREVGLSTELLGYLQQLQYRIPENTPRYARLLVEIAVTMNAIGGSAPEANALFRQALDSYASLDPALVWADYASAHLHYGRFLFDHSHMNEAIAHFQHAIQMLNHPQYQPAMAAAQSELGRAYLGRGQFAEAVSYFEPALAVLKQGEPTPQWARTRTDFATALILLGQLDRAEPLLQEALATCEMLGLWAQQAQVHRIMAYLEQTRAEATQDEQARHHRLNQAEAYLNQAIVEMLPLHNTAELATVYHDLSRLEGRQRKFNEAEAHVRLSSEMFARIGSRRNFAVAQITLGQMLMLKSGDTAAATERIRQALKIAGELGDNYTQQQAAESLIRIHRMQARRAASEPDRRQEILEQIAHSRARLETLKLSEPLAALDALKAELEA